MVLEIYSEATGEWIDIVPYIAYQGFQWQRSDLDGPGAGRDLTGYLRRNRIASKRRLDVTCRPLKSSEASVVLTAIMPEWVTVRYYDVQEGQVVTREMYSNNHPASYLQKHPNGDEWWGGITFPLIEK